MWEETVNCQMTVTSHSRQLKLLLVAHHAPKLQSIRQAHSTHTQTYFRNKFETAGGWRHIAHFWRSCCRYTQRGEIWSQKGQIFFFFHLFPYQRFKIHDALAYSKINIMVLISMHKLLNSVPRTLLPQLFLRFFSCRSWSTKDT